MKTKLNIHQNPYTTPKEYFNDSRDEILFSIQHQKNKEGYSIPEGYFEKSQEILIQKVSPLSQTKIIPIYQRKWVYFTSSIAASLAILWVVFFNSSPSLSDQEILATNEALYETFFEEDSLAYATEKISEELADIDESEDIIEVLYYASLETEIPLKKQDTSKEYSNQQKNETPTEEEAAEEILYELFMEEEDTDEWNYTEEQYNEEYIL